MTAVSAPPARPRPALANRPARGLGARGPRAALARAMRELIDEGCEPLEWAPFYLTGRPA